MGSASIVIDPSPPDRGATVKLKTSGLPPGTVIKVDLNPPGEPKEVVVGEDGTASFVVPKNAEDFIVSNEEYDVEAATTVNP